MLEMTSWFCFLEQGNGPYNNSVCKIPPKMNKLFILWGKISLVIWAMKMKNKLPQSVGVGWKKVQEGVHICMHIADSLCCNTRNQHNIVKQLYSNQKYYLIFSW